MVLLLTQICSDISGPWGKEVAESILKLSHSPMGQHFSQGLGLIELEFLENLVFGVQ